MEHTDIGMNELASIMRGMYGRGAIPIVRGESNDTIAIRRALDLGAQGVLVPLVESADEARRAVRSAKYPPAGIRGYSFSRMNDWGVDFDHYAANANDRIAVVVMIETKAGVEQVKEIATIDGADGIFIGPYDLSGSYGIPGKIDDPVIRDACDQVVSACESAGISSGLHIVSPTKDSIVHAINSRYNFICLGIDVVFLSQGARFARSLLS